VANYSHLCHENRGKPPYQRFIEKVSPEPNTGCWLWTACRDRDGYGLIRIDGKNVRANRFSLENAIGAALPPGIQACHTCDQPDCVNPDHLYAGTNSDNQLDVVRRQRSSRMKLSVDDVKVIKRRRKAGERPSVLAREYGVSDSLIANIMSGYKWRHVT
jgi:hypothetical protein